ncbi:hypothetical protein OO013_00050 [Mangrovivirga sp. M17]|uniref:Uncharacterized protein n=1 Tax=Mangrovivirga halotolerans TaxID=2993936 RepID=A0ABT3RKA1_9BACT|nr:hypothetical protein [Mangrovivirga halotolerans]MCX2742229.1 hypothetical protein [Mangrovivirga halotolerans]
MKDIIDRIKKEKKAYLMNEEEDNSPEYANFFFLTDKNGEEELVNAVLYTLEMYYQSEVFAKAEEETLKRHPEYAKMQKGKELPEHKTEEIEMFLTEVMDQIEEDGEIQVSEHIYEEYEDEVLMVEAGLNIPEVSESEIVNFINKFNNDEISLDDSLYSFELD